MADNTWNGKLSKCISCPNTPKVSKTVTEQTAFVKNLMVKSYFCPRSTDTLHFFDKDFKKGGRHKAGFRYNFLFYIVLSLVTRIQYYCRVTGVSLMKIS